MSGEASTIDLAREVTTAEVEAAEDVANRVIREGRPVVVRSVPADEVASLALRRESSRTGPLRIVEIAGFDVSACGGTHVSSTGEIGMVVVVAVEKVRGGSRLSFLCGGRALRGFRDRRDCLAEVGRRLGVGALDVVAHVDRLLSEARDAERTARSLATELARYRAAAWRAGAETMGPGRVVLRASDLDAADLKALAQEIVTESGLIAVLIGSGTHTPVVVARAADVPFDAGGFVRAATAALGGRGGGRPELAQGGLTASTAEVELFVRRSLVGSH
jgi:alanyl-tRNA synthetase